MTEPNKGGSVSIAGTAIETDVPVPVRDGTVLRADVYRPENQDGELPVLLLRTPYDKRFAQNFVYQHPVWYARHGYMVVVQDARGRYASGGDFYPGRHEAEDGVDTIEWAAALPGSTGKVGTYGFSYPGYVQLLTAAEQPPALACCAPGFTGWDLYDGWAFHGGAFNHAFVLSWIVQFLGISEALVRGDREAALRLATTNLDELYRTQPLGELALLRETGVTPWFFDWLEHETRDDYWREFTLEHRWDSIEVPCLHFGGWYDSFIEGTLTNFKELSQRGRDNHRLLVGPWYHIPWGHKVGGVDFGPNAHNRLDQVHLEWFDHWLKGKPSKLIDEPRVRLFAMGTNEWTDAAEWPPAESAVEDWYLHSSGRASSIGGDGALSTEPPTPDENPDVFAFLPVNPLPSLGGRSCCLPDAAPMGAQDQREVELRNDVLIYSTPPLEEDLEVTGTVELVLYAATDRPDTDWTAKLLDVDSECGCAVNLCDGIVRARYRESLEAAKPVEPGQVYEYVIRVGSTSNVFRRGHQIRLEISSSSFPMYDVNPNTGAPLAEAHLFDSVVATQAVFHDPDHPTRLRLPVVRRNA